METFLLFLAGVAALFAIIGGLIKLFSWAYNKWFKKDDPPPPSGLITDSAELTKEMVEIERDHGPIYRQWFRSGTMVEYALLVVLIAIVALVAVSLAGNEVSSVFPPTTLP